MFTDTEKFAPARGETTRPAAVATHTERRASTTRIVALDAARGLAVLGMFAVHVGPPREMAGAGWLAIFEGRSAALFAVLAGVSLALLSGGDVGRGSTRRIVIRALVIGVLGVGLAALGTPVMVILAYYAVYFLLAIPLLWMPWPALAGLAAVWAVAGPVVSFLIRRGADITDSGGAPIPQNFTSSAGIDQAALQLFVSGGYPVLTWMPFVLAGIALGRMGLRRVNHWSVAGMGAALAALGYGGSWFAMEVLGGRAQLSNMLRAIFAELGEQAPQDQIDSMITMSGMGTAPTSNWWWLATANPHTGTPFEIIGATGVAFLIIGLLMAAGTHAERWLRPLIAVGSCALTVYTVHIVGIRIAFASVLAGEEPAGVLGQPSWQLLAVFVAVALVAATAWCAVLRRGPLEWVLHRLSSRTDSPADPVRRLAATGTLDSLR